MRREHGFSLLETLIAMSLMVVVTASVFSLMNPAQGSFSAQPEVSDMQQRLRVGADMLYKDLVMAGNGAYQGGLNGSLLYYFTPVMPFRQGTVNDDPPGTFRTDTITLMYVPPTFAQTTLAPHGPSFNSSEIGVNPEPGCPPNKADQLCGFNEGMTVLMYDDSGNFDVFTITNVQDQALHLQHNNDKLTYTNYDFNTTKLVQANYFEYYLKTDNANGVYQLMFYDGSGNPDTPVVDNVVGLTFDYYGEPQPPTIKNTSSPWITTYGPSPKAVPPSGSAWAANENCVFAPAPIPTPKLATLGPADSALIKLTAAQLTDGPWCPDAANANRYDADLLRIRKIGVTLRVQAALAALRGPASALFSHGGTSRGGSTWIPDQEIRFMVSPRNLNLGR